MFRSFARSSAAALIASTTLASPALGQGADAGPVVVEGRYIADLMHVAEGPAGADTFLLHDAELVTEVDMERLVGATGLAAGAHLLATAGGRPNEAAGTLQGVDNVEVSSHRAKLYQAWVEQALAGGRASVRLGLTDLNADFYQNDSAGLLIAPAFGIGSELASTGPNGPSIFPSTALTLRISAQVGETGYVRAAIVNAKSGVLGDTGGVDIAMRDGALLIAEAGSTDGGGKLAVGAWGYTQRQDDVRALGPDGEPLKRIAAGAYVLADRRIAGEPGKALNLFLRAGISDGQTTAFRGGFQAGLLVEAPIPGRPDGLLSFGVQQGALAQGFRRSLGDAGLRASSAEWGFELTYADKVLPILTVQPDVQYVRRAYVEGGTRNSVILGVRFILAAGSD